MRDLSTIVEEMEDAIQFHRTEIKKYTTAQEALKIILYEPEATPTQVLNEVRLMDTVIPPPTEDTDVSDPVWRDGKAPYIIEDKLLPDGTSRKAVLWTSIKPGSPKVICASKRCRNEVTRPNSYTGLPRKYCCDVCQGRGG